jgi:hypothetical protein
MALLTAPTGLAAEADLSPGYVVMFPHHPA